MEHLPKEACREAENGSITSDNNKIEKTDLTTDIPEERALVAVVHQNGHALSKSDTEVNNPCKTDEDEEGLEAVDGNGKVFEKFRNFCITTTTCSSSSSSSPSASQSNANSTGSSARSLNAVNNDLSDAFPFNLLGGGGNNNSSTSRNVQRNAPTARAPADFFTDTCHMNHPRRGWCIVINNRKFEPHLQLNERKGSDRDAMMLKLRFEELGFDVKPVVDATAFDMVQIAEYAANSCDHADADCFVMIILSHGDDNGIYGIDGKISADKLYEPFKGDKCLSLAGKPKIFLTQACRGDRLDAGVDLIAVTTTPTPAESLDMEVADTIVFQRIPREADFLYSFSTVPGYFSWRNTEQGSWFVQCLCEEMKQHARNADMDFVRLLTRVNRRVSMQFQSNTPTISTMHEKKQVPSIVSTLTKDLILNVKHDIVAVPPPVSVAAAMSSSVIIKVPEAAVYHYQEESVVSTAIIKKPSASSSTSSSRRPHRQYQHHRSSVEVASEVAATASTVASRAR